MAQRRMISLKIIDTDEFLDMPQSSQYLYYNFIMRADDDGFVSNPKKIIKMVNCNDDDLKILFIKRYVIPFENGVCVIRHWRIHNLIRKDRYIETEYVNERKILELKKGKYELKNTKWQPNGNQMATTGRHSIGKGSIGKGSIGKNEDLSKDRSLVAKKFATDKNKENKIVLKDVNERGMELAQLLYKLIKDENPGWHVRPNFDEWTKDINKIVRIDKRTYEQVEWMIHWCQQDDFWKTNILSPAKLRKQFNRLVVQAKQPKKGGITIL